MLSKQSSSLKCIEKSWVYCIEYLFIMLEVSPLHEASEQSEQYPDDPQSLPESTSIDFHKYACLWILHYNSCLMSLDALKKKIGGRTFTNFFQMSNQYRQDTSAKHYKSFYSVSKFHPRFHCPLLPFPIQPLTAMNACSDDEPGVPFLSPLISCPRHSLCTLKEAWTMPAKLHHAAVTELPIPRHTPIHR